MAFFIQGHRFLPAAVLDATHERYMFMQELNPINNTLKELAERANVLRGYL